MKKLLLCLSLAACTSPQKEEPQRRSELLQPQPRLGEVVNWITNVGERNVFVFDNGPTRCYVLTPTYFRESASISCVRYRE